MLDLNQFEMRPVDTSDFYQDLVYSRGPWTVDHGPGVTEGVSPSGLNLIIGGGAAGRGRWSVDRGFSLGF